MNSQITAAVEFFFRGNKITASVELDLEQYMLTTGRIPPLFPLLAKAANLDVYSYEYEMMQAENITFSHAKGLIADYVTDGVLDSGSFEQAWSENNIIKRLEEIARQNLSIEDLHQHSELKAALLQAYRLGQKTNEKLEAEIPGCC